jgi:hypothetical protein
MPENREFDSAHCLEDCPRCDRCSHTAPRRLRVEALIQQMELENLRYETDRLPISPVTGAEWHSLVMQAMNR